VIGHKVNLLIYLNNGKLFDFNLTTQKSTLIATPSEIIDFDIYQNGNYLVYSMTEGALRAVPIFFSIGDRGDYAVDGEK